MIKYTYDAWGNYTAETLDYYDGKSFINADDISYIEPETINGLNLYSYCGNNPIMFTDPEGKFLVSFMASLAIAALIGACVGVVGTLLSDVVTSALNGNWQFSSWETYLGSAIGGAVGGVVSLFSPFLGAVLAGTISTAAGNIIGKITGSNTASWGEILIDVGFSAVISVAAAGMGKYLRISPITKGSHSFQQVFKSGFTKALKYHFSMSAKTLAKEVGPKGIIVNALCPTKVKTPMCETMEYVQFINDLTGKHFQSVEEMYQGVPFLDVEDIASMVYWLGTSREAGKFNGREVALDLGTLQ